MPASFTYTLDERCPHCGERLATVGSIAVNGHDAAVDSDGRVVEADDTDLCLTDSSPQVICTHCGGLLDPAVNEE